MRVAFVSLLALMTLTASASAQSTALVVRRPTRVTTMVGFMSVGPSVANINKDEQAESGQSVGTQFGALSLSLELRFLFHQRFGFALTPLTWQPSGGLGSGDHWRFVRMGGGPRIQLLSPGRVELTFGYDISYLRTTDVEFCLICEDPAGEESRTFQELGHSVSLRLDTPIGRSASRVGARLEAGISNDASISWLTLGVSLGFGQRPREGVMPQDSRR